MVFRWRRHSYADTDVRLLVVALIAAILGGLLMWWATWSWWYAAVGSVLTNIGGLVIATALLSTFWELVGRRAFLREVLAKAQLRADVVDGGVERVTENYLSDVEWRDLIETATKIDIVVAYANTWRNTHYASLKKAASRKGARIRVFLPDPDDPPTMAALAVRFAKTPDEVRATIAEAIQSFSALPAHETGSVSVYVRSGGWIFSAYRFDFRAVVTLYSHSRERQERVPTLLVGRGFLWDFVYREVSDIKGQSRQIYPVVGGEG